MGTPHLSFGKTNSLRQVLAFACLTTMLLIQLPITAANAAWRTGVQPREGLASATAGGDDQLTKEQSSFRMLEISAVLRKLRAQGAHRDTKDPLLRAQYEQLTLEYKLLAARVGGQANSAKGPEVGPPAIPGVAPVVPPGCTATTEPTATNSTPVPISDEGAPTVTSTITITGAQTFLFDVDITAAISHTFNSDLQVTLTSPTGTVVTLTSNNGEGFNNIFSGVTWDDDADADGTVPFGSNANSTTDSAYADVPPAVPISPLTPEEPLAAFIGEDPNGIWTLTIADQFDIDGGALNSWSLNLTTLSSAPTTTALPVASNNTPQVISGATTPVVSTIAIAGTGTIFDVNVTANITHNFSQDLQINLISPAGTVITLTSNNSDPFFGDVDVYANTTWDDDANPAGQVPYATNAGLTTDHPYVTGVAVPLLAPEEALGAFIGESPTGTWTLRIADTFPTLDDGVLNSWSLTITTAACAGSGDCTLTCPANVTASNDPNLCGAVVNYPPPTSTGTCGTITCSPASGSFFPVGTTTVTCSETNATCTFTVTVNDTQPPIITCPATVTAVTAITCPATTASGVVNFTTTATDNCPGVTLVCAPASGSMFPVGTTTVSCTATDGSGNTATCSFSVTTFDICLQDDSNPATKLLINSVTGDYRFICNGTLFVGKGKVSGLGCDKQLIHAPADRRVRANWSTAVKRGNASIQAPAGTQRCTISDVNLTNNDCATGLPNGITK